MRQLIRTPDLIGSKELNKGKILQKMIENLDPNILKLVGINYSGGVLKILEDESLMNGQDGGQGKSRHEIFGMLWLDQPFKDTLSNV